MTTEETTNNSDAVKKRQASAISGGIFLISLGVLIITNWWWPGIMFAIGLSAGAATIFRGRIRAGVGTILFFSAVSIVVWVIQETRIPWEIVGPLVLVGIGVIILIKVFSFAQVSEDKAYFQLSQFLLHL